MGEYKCVSCGAVKESEEACSCPVCGYKMFETPYDRKDKLTSEIEGFISRLEDCSVTREDLDFEGKKRTTSASPITARSSSMYPAGTARRIS